MTGSVDSDFVYAVKPRGSVVRLRNCVRAAGRQPELDAIAGLILRGGSRWGIAVT